MKHLIVSLRVALVTIVLAGLLYPLAVTAVAQVLFPHRANGSLATDAQGRVVGSELLAQGVTNPGYFQPRPSAAGNGYDPTSSSGSNLGPTSQKLRERVQAEVVRLRRENPKASFPVPSELVTASGSGLDPHLSPEAVRWQLPRVADARGLEEDRIAAVVERSIEGPEFGLLGEPRVNVLQLNLALDRQFGAPPPVGPRPALDP